MRKLSMACYIIRNAKIYISASSLKMIYNAFFHSTMSYRSIIGETDDAVPQFLERKKR
jgi:uncharacterized secreted protein with C-terminal beta-propeller domain